MPCGVNGITCENDGLGGVEEMCSGPPYVAHLSCTVRKLYMIDIIIVHGPGQVKHQKGLLAS